MAGTKQGTVAQLVKAVEAQPLVGVTRAAKILGIATPNFRRYRPRLTAVPVEGGADVFVLSEVEELRDELQGRERGADGRRLAEQHAE